MQFLNRKNKYLDDGTGRKPQQRQNSTTSSSSNNDDDESPTTGKTIIDIPSPTKIPPFKLKTYPQAWFALLLLVLLRTAVSVFQFTFSVVPTFTSEYFGVTLSAVNWLANIQCIIYVIMSFFTGFIFEKLGVKRSVSSGRYDAILSNNVICSSINYCVLIFRSWHQDFYVLLVVPFVALQQKQIHLPICLPWLDKL